MRWAAPSPTAGPTPVAADRTRKSRCDRWRHQAVCVLAASAGSCARMSRGGPTRATRGARARCSGSTRTPNVLTDDHQRRETAGHEIAHLRAPGPRHLRGSPPKDQCYYGGFRRQGPVPAGAHSSTSGLSSRRRSATRCPACCGTDQERTHLSSPTADRGLPPPEQDLGNLGGLPST
jgi:hypothetical protein